MTKIRPILFAIALLLVAAGATLASLGSQTPPDVGPFTVAASRVGDTATFAMFQRDAASSGWEAAGSATIRIDELRSTLGHGGGRYDVVVVSYNQTGEEFLARAGTSGTQTPPAVLFEHIDLASRYVVRVDVKDQAGDIALGFPDLQTPRLDTLAFQGAHLGPGADLTERVRLDGDIQIRGGLYMSFDFPGLLTPDVVAIEPVTSDHTWGRVTLHAAEVAAAGTIDGADVLGVRTRLRVDFDRGHEFAGGHQRIVKTDYFTPGIPYPVATHQDVTMVLPGHETRSIERVRSLASYTPGLGAPVAWPDGVTAAPAADPVAWKRSDRLESGPRSTLDYRLDEALADVGRAPGYLVWSLQNPEHDLVSAKLQRAGSSGAASAAYEWELTFATADGESYAVEVERAAGASAGTVTGGVARSSLAGYRPDRLPERPVLLAEIERAWALTASTEYQDGAPDYLVWGFAHGGSSMDAVCPLPTGMAPSIDVLDIDPLHYVVIGRSNAGECTSADATQKTSALLFHLESGMPLWSYEVRRDVDRPLLPADEDAPAIAATALAPDFNAPVLATGLIALGGLALAALVLYLLPALQYAAAKASLVVPGFSRLERDGLLDHRVRDELMTQIRADPGVHAHELRRRVQIGWGTLVHHIGMLERNKLVSSLIDGRNRRFFPVGEVDWSARGQLAVLQNTNTRALYDEVLATPGIATTPLSKKLGLSTAGAMWHLRRLEDAGLVVREKIGRTVFYRARPVDMGVAADRSVVAAP